MDSHSKESSRDSSQTRLGKQQQQSSLTSPHRTRTLAVWAKLARRVSGALLGGGGHRQNVSEGSSGDTASAELEQQLLVTELELVLASAFTLDLRALEPRLDLLLEVCARRRDALVSAVRTRFGWHALVLQRAPHPHATAPHHSTPASSTSGDNKPNLYIVFLVPSAADSRQHSSTRQEQHQHQHPHQHSSTRSTPQCFFLLSITSAVSSSSSSSLATSSSAAAAAAARPKQPARSKAVGAKASLKLVVSKQFASAEALLAQLLPPLAFQQLDSARNLSLAAPHRPAQTLASYLQAIVRFLTHTVCWIPNSSNLLLLPRKK